MGIRLKSYVEVEWTSEIDALIGDVPDRMISERYGIAARSVAVRRRKLGKISTAAANKTEEPKWSKKLDKRIGTMPDTDLAKLIGTTKYHVRERRIALGIPAFQAAPLPPATLPVRKKLELTEAQKAKLGTVPDTVLAERWNVTAGTVTRLRISFGIAPFQQGGELEWTVGMLNLLGEIPDGTLAREYEISPFSVKLKRIELGILPFGKTTMDPEPELPKRMVELIGQIPDKHLSDQFGVHRRHIQLYRALHKIPLADYQKPVLHAWTAAEEALLGTISDGNVARRLQIPATQVSHHRKTLGIAPFNRKEKVRWTNAKLKQLGKEPDHLLARNWGYPQATVRAKRESLQIPLCKRNARKWSTEELRVLGTMPDTQLARQLGVSQTCVNNKRQELGIAPFHAAGPYQWKKADLKKLGTVPDDELAIELGLSYQFVAQTRLERGIQPLRRSQLRWTDEVIKKMGMVSDSKLAAELGCSQSLVTMKRRELQIPSILESVSVQRNL